MNNKTEYALEGSVFVGGAVIQWLRDYMNFISTASESEKLALSATDSGGVYFVPAFTGLGAPYWDPDTRGAIIGVTRGTSKSQITRAALESIAFQSGALIKAMEEDCGKHIKKLKVDGGAAQNNFLMQFQADILGIPVVRSKVSETTALGAAYLAGLYNGYWESKNDIIENWQEKSTFKPVMDTNKRARILSNWDKAVKAVREFKL